MLIGLFSLLFVLVLGTGQSPYIIPNVEKLVDKNIHDKERKAEVKTLSKTFMKEWKEMNKIEKKQNKEIISMIKDRSVGADQLTAQLNQSLTKMRASDKNLGDLRMEIQQIMTDEEWQATLKQISDETIKKTKKLDKDEIKTWVARNKKFVKLSSTISSSIVDGKSRDECLADVLSFEEDMAEVLYENQDQANQVIEVMQSRSATRDQIGSITDGIETYKQASGTSFIKLRTELINSSDEETWPRLAKALAEFAE